MRRQVPMWAFLLTLIAVGQALGGEQKGCESCQDCFLLKMQPVGGWRPYGGGLLTWWNHQCSPRCGGPDDYCRKPLPRVCCPPYPSYYIWGPPEICYPKCNGGRVVIAALRTGADTGELSEAIRNSCLGETQGTDGPGRLGVR
jgi:hypothetical protein